MAFEFIKGIFNPDRNVNAEKTAKNLNKTIKSLSNHGGTEAREHIAALEKHAAELAKHKINYENAVISGSGVAEAKSAFRDANKEVNNAIKAGRSHISGEKSYVRGQRFGRIVSSKPVLIIAGLAAAIGAVSWVGNKRKEKIRDSQNELRDQKIDSMRTENTAVQAQPSTNTLMGLEPVAGDHAARVVAGRNGGMGGVDASNPPVNMQFEAVRT